MPSVSRYMTREPYSIAVNATLADANQLMKQHDIRHLPVMEGAKIVGVVSTHDVRVIAAIPDLNLCHINISRITTTAVCVWGETPLDEVASMMATKKCDCVIVLGGQGVQGIFTAIDALRALGEILERATA